MSQEAHFRTDHPGHEAGTGLLACTSAWQLVTGYAEFIAATELPAWDVFSDMVVSTPLPRYVPGFDGRRWSVVPPDALWSPLFWLPGKLHQRLDLDDAEPERVWAVRVALELQAAGLYDPQRGWFDVLAAHELDDFGRIEAWQSGGADRRLDAIDLTEHLVAREDDDWAAELALDLVPPLQRRGWALCADELLGFIGEVDEGEDALARARSVVGLAHGVLLAASEDATSFWATLEEQLDHDVDQVLSVARDRLQEIRAEHWDAVEDLQQLTSA